MGSVLADLQEISRTDEKGRVSFHDLSRYHSSIAILNSAIEFTESFPKSSQSEVISKAARTAIGKGRLSQERLKVLLSQAEQKYLELPLRSYILAMSWSVHYFPALRRRRLLTTSLTFSRFLPEQFDQEGSRLRFRERLRTDPPTNYPAIRVRVRARSISEAFNKGIFAIDFLRGIWNYCLNLGRLWGTSTPEMGPLNSVVLGPVHTLHEVGGAKATEVFWYEPDYRKPQSLFHLDRDWDLLQVKEKTIRRIIAKSNDQDWFADAFVKYTRALDQVQYENAFLKLWSLLETLTGTQRERYDELIARASFIWSDVDRARLELNHLRDCRSYSVHSGEETQQAEIRVYQLKKYVEALIKFTLGSISKYDSVDDLHELLKLPHSVDTLDKRLRLLRNARKFRLPIK